MGEFLDFLATDALAENAGWARSWDGATMRACVSNRPTPAAS
jgi:hypothetical protein